MCFSASTGGGRCSQIRNTTVKANTMQPRGVHSLLFVVCLRSDCFCGLFSLKPSNLLHNLLSKMIVACVSERSHGVPTVVSALYISDRQLQKVAIIFPSFSSKNRTCARLRGLVVNRASNCLITFYSFYNGGCSFHRLVLDKLFYAWILISWTFPTSC